MQLSIKPEFDIEMIILCVYHDIHNRISFSLKIDIGSSSDLS